MFDKKDVFIRKAIRDDLEDIVKIYNSTIAGRMVTADTEPVTVESRVKWFEDHDPNFRPLWVVKHDDKICGWLSFQSFYGRPAYNATVEISIYVAEDIRGKGLGKILMDKAIEACSELNIKTILGFIFGHNRPSLRLFYSYGFTDWGVFPGVAELDNVERDLIIVGKRVR